MVDYAASGYMLTGRRRRLRAREVVMVAMLSALTIVGNLLSFTFMPIQAGTAMVIISGVAFGPWVGVIVGALSRFICNFYLGQGIHTIFQMVGWALLGFLSGVCFKPNRGLNRNWLTVFTFIVVFFVYGILLNFSTFLFSGFMLDTEFDFKNLRAVYSAGIVYDLIHALKASLFIFFFGRFITDKLERIKIKYGFYRIR